MKTLLTGLIVSLALLVSTGLNAEEITVYKDQDGVINLTDRPAPADAQIQQVIHYKEESAAELTEQQKMAEQKHQDSEKQKEALELQELKEKAARARAEADKERALAREKTKAAEAYLERYNQKRRSQRRRHRQTAQRVAQEAKEAQARADAAITRANLAQEEVRKASPGPTGQTSDDQMDKEK